MSVNHCRRFLVPCFIVAILASSCSNDSNEAEHYNNSRIDDGNKDDDGSKGNDGNKDDDDDITCDKECEKGEVCEGGECVSVCKPPSFYCSFTAEGSDEEKEFCLDPGHIDTCGVKSCEEFKTAESCEEGYSCVFDAESDTYACQCESGLIKEIADGNGNIKKYCIDPSLNHHCGATKENMDGTPCPDGTKCIKYDILDTSGEITGTSYRCSCPEAWKISCHHEDNALVDCIDPAISNELCSAPDCSDKTTYRCDAHSHCDNGMCVCDNPLMACNQECIDATSNDSFCGAKGLCNSDDESSPNYKGKTCSDREICSNGECICKEGYVKCGNACKLRIDDDACGVRLNDKNECVFEDCSSKGMTCDIGETSYFCKCPDNMVKCDGECIDPLTTATHCGASGFCNTASVGDDYVGKDCTKDSVNDKCFEGKCTNKCPSGYTFCDGLCVNMNEYHLTADCKSCGSFDYVEYCYTGERDAATKEIIDFDFRKCLLKANGKDLNKLHSIDYCGKTCQDAVACPEGYQCIDGQNCICDDSRIECYQSEAASQNSESVMHCIDPNETHQTACGECMEGWADCDKDWWNGCETKTKDDIYNCGACGYICSEHLQNISGIKCDNGKCGYAYCNVNFGDCNVNEEQGLSDGCEMSGLISDPQNCSECGNVCDGGGCQNGICCGTNGMTSDSKDLNCCEGTKLYKYEHATTLLFLGCTESTHYGCYAADPDGDDDCWKEVAY